MAGKIADIRKTYSKKSLTESSAAADPIKQFGKWWKEALKSGIDEVNAMTLATASADGVPAARIVLLKDYSEDGFVFFTNYSSAKGAEIAENPRVCLVFFWKELERQVKITGMIEKIAAHESDEYFHSRPWESQVGAITSPQSKVIRNREWLQKRFKTLSKQYKGKTVPRPEHWGGYVVKPAVIEFWQGRPGRLHDRLQYRLNEKMKWVMERLAP